ncbi:heme peroxidase [Mycena metata]|uniref:Heme peroxidase n=1 Tax=Mycena metata TaxID=1033252 RepID=A0AAD7NP67_9AGAR|nr:heme peroxidase [Mycena metata]
MSFKSFIDHITSLVPNQVSEHSTRTLPFELSDIPGYWDAATHFSSIDDRKFLLENLVVLMSRLPDAPGPAALSNTVQHALIDILYKDLPHPPAGYLSSLSQSTATATAANPIKYAYRNADGSNYVPLFPGLGKANSPYARSVPTTNFTPLATLPDSGLLFDTLLRRDAFEPHPGGISALFFAFADLVIHSIFNTNQPDATINMTSSYLDLAILYGNNDTQCDGVRNKDGRGRLWEDVFADSRLLFMPPAACALLVLLSRNHNFTAQKILEINERGTYKTTFTDDAEKRAQDDEIFNRARLVNCGFFMQIILGDYVGAILGLVSDGYSWRLDPLSASREPTHELTPRGEGNVVSIEFNLLYRWHATLSEKDTEWTENLFTELFKKPDGSPVDFSSITPQDFRVAAEKMKPDPDVKKWTFNKLQRGPDGRFKDADLAHILHDSTSWRAGSYRARGIPEVLRVIETLGIEQARRWGTCSMNDFRRFLGLKPYANFQEWNPDPAVNKPAAALYKDIENLELYVGLQAEETKKPMPGAGLCPGYTISRSILADAVCLTRGDRFLTIEFTPFNLTTWGYRDCQFDTKDGSYGGMLTKLLFRTLPAYYPASSAYAHFPFLDPEYMRDQMTERDPKLADKYIWTRPAEPEADNVVVVASEAGVREVLEREDLFPNRYAERMQVVTGRGEVDRRAVNRLLAQDTKKWAEYFGVKAGELIKARSMDHIGKDGQVQYLDVVRDVINVLPVYWICQQIAGLPLNGDDLKDEQKHYELFSDVGRYVFLNAEPTNDWKLRESSVKTYKKFETAVRKHLGSWLLDTDHASNAQSKPFLDKLYKVSEELGQDDADLVAALFTEIVPTAAHWSQAIAHVVNFYLDAPQSETRQEIVALAQKGTVEDNAVVADHIRHALAQNPPVWGVYRTAQQADSIVDSVNVQAGTRVFASIKEANMQAGASGRGPILGTGEHGLLSHDFFVSTAPQVLGKILGLKNLKRAPGTSGKFNKFVDTTHGAQQQWYVNARSDVVPWPESLVVEYHV